MCDCKVHKESSSWNGGKNYRLADFFDRWWDTYKRSPRHYITEAQYKAVNAIRVCRTETLGVDHYACPDCGEITQVYHSCKNRFCPTCSWYDTLKWAERVKEQMLSLPHRHTVMTLPHQFNDLIKANGSLLLSALMRVAAGTMKDWMKHKYNLRPGIISVLHTFGEKKDYHVHVHMIVSWGGISNLDKSLQPIKGEYVNYEFLKRKFQLKFNDELFAMFDNGILEHHFSSRHDFVRFLGQINKKKWILNLEPPMNIPTQVIRYVGRYSKRACLSEYKITKMEGENISFRYKDNKTKDVNNKPVERELDLHYRDFIPRLLQHVPLKYFRLVRYYGIYSNRSSVPDEYLYKATDPTSETVAESWGNLQEEITGKNPLICPHCEIRKIYLHTTILCCRGRILIKLKGKIPRSDEFPDSQVA